MIKKQIISVQRRNKIPIKKKKKKKVCLLKFRKWWSSWSQKAVTFSSAIRCCAHQHSSPAHILWTLFNCSHCCENWHCTYLITPHLSCSRELSLSVLGFSAAPKRDACEDWVNHSETIPSVYPVKWEFPLHGATLDQPWESCNQLSGGFYKVP